MQEAADSEANPRGERNRNGGARVAAAIHALLQPRALQLARVLRQLLRGAGAKRFG